MKPALISICVPAYRYPEGLKRLLESVRHQEMQEYLEIVVGEDGETYATREIIQQFGDLNIVYFENKKNLGFDRNIIEVTKHASGDFVWWLGHDDELEKGIVGKFLPVLTRHADIDFCWVDFVAGTRKELVGNLGASRFFDDGSEVVEKIANSLGFISSIIMRRSLLMQVLNKGDIDIGGGFANLDIVLQILSTGHKFYYLGFPGIVCHPTSQGKHSYDGFQVFAVNFYTIVKQRALAFKRGAVHKMLAKNFGHVWRGILVARARGEKTGLGGPSVKIETIARYYWNFGEFWFALPFLMMPRWMIRGLYRAYKRFFNERKFMRSVQKKPSLI